jgi:hypothetical protein
MSSLNGFKNRLLEFPLYLLALLISVRLAVKVKKSA